MHSEAVGPHGTVAPRPVQSGVVTNAPAAAAAEPSRPAAAQRTSPAADTPVAAPATKPRGYGLKEGLFSILKLLGLALLLGLIGRQLGRSFWRWAIAGCVLWAALVLLKVMKF